MLLSRPDLLSEVEKNRLRFAPEIDPSRVEQVSIDLRLGHSFTKFKTELPGYLASVHLDGSIFAAPDIWDRNESDEYTLSPGGFVLGQTLERVSMPNDLAGLVEGRSTLARLGLSIHVTAPKIDPGFDGTITLEMTNHGRLNLRLRAGIDRIAQLMIFRISTPLPDDQLYGSSAAHLFQGQSEPIPPARR